MEWMGSPLLPMDDVPLACRLLQTMGAQRVLVVAPQTALRHQPDALEQASGFFMPCAREMGGNVGVFRIPLPEKFGALSLSDLLLGADAGARGRRAGDGGGVDASGYAAVPCASVQAQAYCTVRSTVAF